MFTCLVKHADTSSTFLGVVSLSENRNSTGEGGARYSLWPSGEGRVHSSIIEIPDTIESFNCSAPEDNVGDDGGNIADWLHRTTAGGCDVTLLMVSSVVGWIGVWLVKTATNGYFGGLDK